MHLALIPLFMLTALIYASVGFGGGSTYIALLLLFDLPYQSIPITALLCNLTVVSYSSLRFYQKKKIDFRLLEPFLLCSIPMAMLGGALSISKDSFQWIASISLLIAGCRLLFSKKTLSKEFKGSEQSKDQKRLHPGLAYLSGALIGLLSGIIGIGGGIFLAPLLYYFNAARSETIAASASLFIFVNSIFGLIGQLSKFSSIAMSPSLFLLPLAVFIGGMVGNHLSLQFLLPKHLQKITGSVVLLVAIRLGLRV